VPSPKKSTYLAAHDYGAGGIWILIDAESPEQVERVYPQLKVVDARPPWLDGQLWENIQARSRYDIDAPSGWLLSLKRSDGT
jgi:hypothetical protein